MSERIRVAVEGVVQGVGFRPFVFRLASQLGLSGFVRNSTSGLLIEVQGTGANVESFPDHLQQRAPSASRIDGVSVTSLPVENDSAFRILDSTCFDPAAAVLPPDNATCEECLLELFDPEDRRYLYPFISCAQCGPRFSITNTLPFDRSRTAMEDFTMCPLCTAEFENPDDRRFHAQTHCCPACGPALSWCSSAGEFAARSDEALEVCIKEIEGGGIVAVKGIGGFHLFCDARSETAVSRLRDLKRRQRKPFAVMYPDVLSLALECNISPAEELLLRSRAAPIVLLKKKQAQLAGSVAPANDRLGVMLPYTALHHLLLNSLRFPVVATSANLAEEPICFYVEQLRESFRESFEGGRLDGILTHNRKILHPVDDSVMQIIGESSQVLRLGRGLAPFTCPLPFIAPGYRAKAAIAVGAGQKCAIAISNRRVAILSQHIGELDSAQSYEAFRRTIADYSRIYGTAGAEFVIDFHPDYASSRFARDHSACRVQHHLAHVFSCAAEHGIDAPFLGVAWDGTGLGTDGSVWGGEFLDVSPESWSRVGSIHPFSLPGGERAVREPRLVAAALLYETFNERLHENIPASWTGVMSDEELHVTVKMIAKRINSPITSSIGRLFDGISSLLGICHHNSFEGEAALLLEQQSAARETPSAYNLENRNGLLLLDWRPMVQELLLDQASAGARFHSTLVHAACSMIERFGVETVLLSGGCFQNRVLTGGLTAELTRRGHRVYWNSRIPPNDGGIALGQLAVYLRGYDVFGRSRQS